METVPPTPAPQYNPAVLVLDVQRVLGQKGIHVVIDQPTAYAAQLAAADLLRALHVEPASSPAPAPRPPRCERHPAYEADNCPGCGTSEEIGRRS